MDPEVPGSNPGGGTIPGRQRDIRFAIGVTGHRLNQLPNAAHATLEAGIAYAMALVHAAAVEAAGAAISPVLVSALAEGADRFAAMAASRRKWRLETPLPFEIARYEEDFADDASKSEFRAFLKRSKRVEISPAALEPSPAPYAAVGEMIVAWSDVLLAIWNGAPPKGPGGTSEVAAKMLAAGRPVVWIPSDTGGPLQLIAPQAAAGALAQALARRIAVITQPAAMRIA